MKKHIRISILFLSLCILISGCASVDTKEKISDHKWEMESVSDLEGNLLENEMIVIFNDDNSFILTDKSNDKKWQGNYKTEKVDSSYKLDLYIDNKEEAIIGVYGIRENNDKTKIASITFQLEDKILSFIASE